MSPDYSTLEEILRRGFITSELSIGEVPVVLKSIGQPEMEMLDLRCPTSRTDWLTRACWLLAYSTLLFNRVNVLPDRDESLHFLADQYAELPDPVVASLIREAWRLNEATRDQISYVQPYTFGTESRKRWQTVKDSRLNDPSITGIPGTDRLGLNPHQELWIYLNRLEDKEESFDRHWEVAKFVASAHAPKGVKKINNRDKQRRQKRDRKREALYRGKGEIKYDQDDEIRVLDESPEELMDQMDRAVRGEKDYHDAVIDAYEKKVQRNMEEEIEERKERAQKRRAEREERLKKVSDDVPFVVYTEDEVEEHVKESDKKRWDRIEEAAENDPPATYDKQSMKRLKKWGMAPDSDDDDRSEGRKDPEDPFNHPLLDESWDAVAENVDEPE